MGGYSTAIQRATVLGCGMDLDSINRSYYGHYLTLYKEMSCCLSFCYLNRMIQQAFIDMENMFELLREQPEVLFRL